MTDGRVVPDSDPIVARPWPGPPPPSRILAIRLQALGDTVITLPYLQALRRAVPGVGLDLLTCKEVADIPRSVVLFDRVFAIGGGRAFKWQLLSALTLIPALWARRYDIVIDLQRNRISRLVRQILRPQAWSEFDRFSPALAGERTRATIEAVGLGSLYVLPGPELKAPGAGLDKLRSAGWDGASDLVVLNPAGAVPDRNWPIENYVEFCRMWTERRQGSVQFLLLGDRRIQAKAVHLRHAVGERVIDLTNQTTPSEAFAILRRATLVLSEDSGLMHMSWVNGVPTVALFGASRWVWAQPHGNYSALISMCREPDGRCMDGTCRAGQPHCLALQNPGGVAGIALGLIDRALRAPRRIAPL